MKIARLLMLLAALGLGTQVLAAAASKKGKPKPKPTAADSKGNTPEAKADTMNAVAQPTVEPAADKSALKDETGTAEPATKYAKLAEQLVAGDATASSQLMKAVGEGDCDARDALIAVLNAKLAHNLEPKAEKGDLDAIQKLIRIVKEKDPSARKALDKAYGVLADKAAGGEKKSSLALEYAAQEGEDVQYFLDRATVAKEKANTEEPPAAPPAP